MLEDILASKGEEFYDEHVSTLKSYFDSVKKETIRNMMLSENIRLMVVRWMRSDQFGQK